VKTKTITLPEDLLQLQAELMIMRSECLRMADRCQRLIKHFSPAEEPEMFDTGEPTSAYVNQDR
jgi:hypothetical protein